MAYELYVLNQRLPRFPLKDGHSQPQSLQQEASRIFGVWLTETVVGNLQRRKACHQIFEFAVWMERVKVTLETVNESHFADFLTERGEKPLCPFAGFLKAVRLRLPQLGTGAAQ